MRKGEKRFTITPNWSTLSQLDVDFTDALLTNVQVALNVNIPFKSRLIFIEVNGKEISLIETTEEHSSNNGNLNDGNIYYHTYDGTFFDAYKISDGKVSHRLIVQEKIQKASLFSFISFFQDDDDDCDEKLNPNSKFCNNHLEEVVIGGHSSSSSPIPILSLFGHGASITDVTSNASGGGGGNNSAFTPCVNGKVKDKSGNCVEKPCDGDPVVNPEIAPQKNSGTKGGMYGNTRKKKNPNGRGLLPKFHGGVDLKNNYGSPVFALYDGTVTQHWFPKAGYIVAISSVVDGKEVLVQYFHLQEKNRALGKVKKGAIVGYQGDSGNLKGAIQSGFAVSHVHLKIKENGKIVDPLNHLKTKINKNTGKVEEPCSN
ncbi:M23 family metallopeptidase [Tenacibaculum jejuense]|uniref:M23 family metallopeptidase n=1 Tax=Tenacibaculum jejuense TaxID=584609 RepID=UPI0012FD1B4D|nr:M23 family metallopeptidase [Tenacibaculum jejuense]